MGDASYSVKHRAEHRFVLRSPTPAVEMEKAIQWASAKFAEHRGRPVQFDDDIMIESEDERIVVFFWVHDGSLADVPNSVERNKP